MQWIPYLSYFLGGAFFANAIPHYVSGVTGKAFQTPFAKPPGKGLSSSTVNVLWAAFNTAIAWLLIFRVGNFNLFSGAHNVCVGIGGLAMSLLLARTFGKLHGGDL